jgi:antirestriction protein ArdC
VSESISLPATSAQLLRQIEDGIAAARSSDQFQAYLRAAARFHTYSLGNVLLIALQKPKATRVAGFHTWLKLGRHVRKGEHGIRILAPCVVRPAADQEKDASKTPSPIFYKAVSVFDISQTEGEELPSPVRLLEGDDAGLFAVLAAVAEAEGLSLQRDAQAVGANGYYAAAERRIWVSPEVTPLMSAKTLAHELAHHFAQHALNGDCREEAETIAEAAAFIVLNHFGFDSGGYSFGYLASWSDTKVFRAKLGEIQRTARQIIVAVEREGLPSALGAVPDGEIFVAS